MDGSIEGWMDGWNPGVKVLHVGVDVVVDVSIGYAMLGYDVQCCAVLCCARAE